MSCVAVSATAASCARAHPLAVAGPPDGYTVVDTFPHDDAAFTEGFAFRGSRLFEGTGIEGHSNIRRVDLESGKVLRQADLDDQFFGEGVTVLGRKAYELTWQEHRCFVYEAGTLKILDVFAYETEGWGLTNDGKLLVMSDGTDVIRFRDPKTFEVVREIHVTDSGAAVSSLNELEWVDGEIYANVFPTDDVVRIDPDTGEVLGRFNLAALRAKEQAAGHPDVTNGIAYLPAEDRLFVTGKYWAHVYEIELTDLPG